MKKKNEYMVLRSDYNFTVRANKTLLHDFNIACTTNNATLSTEIKSLVVNFITDDEYSKKVLNNDDVYYKTMKHDSQTGIYIAKKIIDDFKNKCQALSVKPSKVMRSLLIDYIDKHQDNTKTTPTSEKDKKKLYYLSQATNYATSFRISRELYDDFQDKCKRQNLDYAKTVRHCMIDWLIDDDK